MRGNRRRQRHIRVPSGAGPRSRSAPLRQCWRGCCSGLGCGVMPKPRSERMSACALRSARPWRMSAGAASKVSTAEASATASASTTLRISREHAESCQQRCSGNQSELDVALRHGILPEVHCPQYTLPRNCLDAYRPPAVSLAGEAPCADAPIGRPICAATSR
jgi:hypothetical protein